MWREIQKMSTFSLLLRRAFSSATSHLTYKEKDIKKLVDSFKKNSQSSDFRRKASYYELTVNRLVEANAFKSIEEILEEQKKFQDITFENFNVRLIMLYGKSGLFDLAHQVFDEMPERKCVRTVKYFNALLEACVKSKRFDKMDEFFRELPEKLGVKRDIVSYNIVIKGFCDMGSFDLAASILDEMEKDGVNPDVFTFNTLIGAFYKKGRFLEGDMMWDMMGKYNVVPNIVTYNKKLLGLVLQEKPEKVIDLVDEIKNKGLKLDVFAFNILFKSLSSDGKYFKKAKKWYNEMMITKCEPNIVTFSTLLPFACDNDDFRFGARMCRALFHRQIWLKDVALVQKVIDGLVKQSYVNEAELLDHPQRHEG